MTTEVGAGLDPKRGRAPYAEFGIRYEIHSGFTEGGS